MKRKPKQRNISLKDNTAYYGTVPTDQKVAVRVGGWSIGPNGFKSYSKIINPAKSK